MFGQLVESIRLEASRPRSERVSRKKVNRYTAMFRGHSDPMLRRVSRADARKMAQKAKDRDNKLAPQFVHTMRKDSGAGKQSSERQAKYRDRVRYDWQKK